MPEESAWRLSRGIFLRGVARLAAMTARLPDLTQALESEGVAISYSDDPSLIPDDFRDPSDTLVVYTPAVPECHAGLSWFRQNGFEVVKRAQVLGRVTRETTAICFAGTHGKNNHQPGMAAHLLKVSGVGCTPFSAEFYGITTPTICLTRLHRMQS